MALVAVDTGQGRHPGCASTQLLMFSYALAYSSKAVEHGTLMPVIVNSGIADGHVAPVCLQSDCCVQAGDDMGLGKTMQCCAFLAGMFGSGLAARALIVAPKTLLAHWKKELATCGLTNLTHEYYGTSQCDR